MIIFLSRIGSKEIKEIEEEYRIYGGGIRKLGEGFSWLADSLAAVAEDLGWNKKKNKKEELARIKILSERLAWGVEEGGLGLARLHIPGLSRSYISALMREGYDNEKCLKELSEEELVKVLPKILAGRIKKRLYAETVKVKDGNLQDNSSAEEGRRKVCPYMQDNSRNLKANTLLGKPEIKNCSKPITVLEIDQHRPDRIIFEGKKIGVTSTEFSLIRFLAQHPEQVMSYDELLGELWKDEEDAIYNRVSFHLSKKIYFRGSSRKRGNVKIKSGRN
jgi:helicase